MKNSSRQSLSLALWSGTAVKAMDHVDVGAGNGIEWSCLVLAVFEIPLFMRAERMRQQFADIAPEIRRFRSGRIAADRGLQSVRQPKATKSDFPSRRASISKQRRRRPTVGLGTPYR